MFFGQLLYLKLILKVNSLSIPLHLVNAADALPEVTQVFIDGNFLVKKLVDDVLFLEAAEASKYRGNELDRQINKDDEWKSDQDGNGVIRPV